jgi:hypothetical protein
MSTRSCIARRTGDATFIGVYHHWDGYPTALGATLYELYRGHFQRDLGRMLNFLIDQHPAGWSTINGKDFTLAAGFKADDDTIPCAQCGLEQWKHYRQYYAKHRMAKFVANLEQGIVMVLGHAHVRPKIEQPQGPECYCHGSRKEEAQPITEKDDAGMEWAYVFDEPERKMYVFERLFADDAGPGQKLFTGEPVADLAHHHMTGMFGMGAPGHQYWATAAVVDLDGPEPDWERVGAEKYTLDKLETA